MKQLNVGIISNEKITPRFYKMRVKSEYLAKNIKPGQFVEVRCSDGFDPLLRKPLGAHRIYKDGVELLYEVVGKGTDLLSRKVKGKSIDLIGPLGNGFDLRTTNACPPKFEERRRDKRQTTILIAGGIGVAPLVALAEELAKRGNKACAIIGAKTKSHILCETEITPRGCDLRVSTEDGSKGYKGLATDVLKNLLSTVSCQLSAVFACGPTAMLKEVAHIAARRKIPCQVLLEEYMACGVGVCLGCPVKVKKETGGYEYKMVCKDGPVFDAKEIAW